MLNGVEMQSQRVETDILNWTSFQDTGVGGEVLFTIPRKGVMAGENVSLNLTLLKPTATNKMPMCVGILGCLEEATLFYQNEAIQSTRFAGLRNRLMNLREDPDVRSQKHNVEYGASLYYARLGGVVARVKQIELANKGINGVEAQNVLRYSGQVQQLIRSNIEIIHENIDETVLEAFDCQDRKQQIRVLQENSSHYRLFFELVNKYGVGYIMNGPII